jgi:transcriptional regulator with GAF, ATPase, and Fis domain
MSVLSIPESAQREIDDLNSQAWGINRENPPKAIELAHGALLRATGINYKKGIALAMKTLGACYIWTSRNEEGVEYCLKANELFKELRDKENGAVVYVNLGTNFYFLSDFDTAIKCYKTGYELNSKIGFEPGMADALNGIGTVHYSTGQNEKALEALLEAEKLSRKHNRKGSLVKILDGIGETYHNLGQYEKALQYYNDCIEFCNEVDSPQTKGYVLEGMGRTYTELNKFDRGLESLTESLSIRRKLGFKLGEANTLIFLGNLYLRKKDHKKAIEYFDEAYALATDINSKECMHKASEKLAELYEDQGNFSEALKYHKLFAQARDEVRSFKNEQITKSFELQNRVLQSAAEKAILEEKAKELEGFNESLTLMSQLGQQIISSLSVETIVDTAYKNINALLDATGFGIGLYKKSSDTIVFPLYIEGEDTFENIVYDRSDNDRLTVQCFNETKEIIINDFDNEIGKFIRNASKPKAGRNVESLIYLPLRFKDETLGVITVQSFSKNAYSAYHVNIFRNLAAYTAIALENARLYEEQEQKVQERTLELSQSNEAIERTYLENKKINEIGRKITSNLNLGNIFKELYDNINEIMSVECFGVRIYRPETNTVDYQYEMEKGVVFDEVHSIPLTDDNNYTVWCIKNKKDIFLNDNRKEYSKYVKQIRVVTGDMPNSLLFTPMMIGEKIIGVITVQSFEYNAYEPRHLEMLRTLGTYTAIALENAWLYENTEAKVLERTAEVVRQKEEIEKTFENTRLVSEIGQEISSTFSISEIISKVYNSINKLMDATMFGIGIYDASIEQINFIGAIENGVTLDDYCYKLSDSHRPAILCFTSQQPIVIHNFTEEFVQSNKITSRHSLPGQNTESIIYIPLTQNNKRIGVITVQSFRAHAYNDYHLQLLKSLAIYTAIALDNASLYTQMEDRVIERTTEIEKNYQNTRLLGEISKEISSSLSLETIISSVYKHINSLMRADGFGIAIYDKKLNKLEFKGFRENGELLPDINIDLTDMNRLGPVCFVKQQEIIINDFHNEYSKYIQLQQAPIIGNSNQSIIYLPLFSSSGIIGVITVQSLEKNSYPPYLVDLIKNLAVSIGIALDNASLYKNMEEKVADRTLEVVKQKEEIEKTFENTRLVSEIGREISGTLSINEIISKVYNRINQLMDATMFGIGVYDPENEQINFSGVIEKGQTLEDYFYKITNIDRPAVWCFTNQKDYVIHNFTEEFVKSNKVKDYNAIQGDSTESIIYVPLTHKDKRIGVITVQSYYANVYSDYHLQLLKSLAIYAAIAIDNASLYSGMEERVKERTAEIEKNYNDTRLLSQIAEDISSSLSVETIISKLYENVNKLMDATMFGIGLHNPESNSLEFKGFVENDEVMPDFSFSLEDHNRLAVFAFESGTDVLIHDYSTEYKKYIKTTRPPVSGKDSSSIVYIPIYAKGKIIGVFTVQSFEKHAYSEYLFNILKNLAVSIGVALDNANLYQNLEEKVKERTLEVIRQKEQIEKTFEDTRTLSKIGNDITSTLSIEDIIDKVYSKVNTLMDAVGFGVGLYNKDTGKIIFPLYIEGEEKFSSITYDISEKDKLTNICYSQNREIVINDFLSEIESWVGKIQSPVVGKAVQSIIYLPMMLKERVIGVITVQSFNKNAYTDYHVQILKNLAVYVAIAVDNASLYQNLEDRVIERTAEVTRQKELIEKTLEDVRLSAQIAKDIASSLSVETIVSKVYENVRKIVKAESFGIGLYQPQSNTILFSGFIEKGEKLDDVHISLNDKERYAVMAFEQDIEVIINDHEKEFSRYTKDLKKPIVGEIPESLVYLPLYTKDKKIGVLTAQCFTKDAFQDFQVNILKNMALSIAIALDNASLYQNLEEKVKERTAEVHKQKAIIEEKNKDITDSIRYAKKIQQAIAPEIDKFNKNFEESFILYKPKDIVSGDFYWFEHFEKTTVFAAADCTGHGVPGAFMSLICSDIMYKVIGDKKVFDPGKALDQIDEKLVRLIKKSSESSANDGMDIALCAYLKDKKKLLYAGAHRPLLHIRNGEMIEHKPSKFSIGGHSTEGKKFEQIEIDVKPGDMFYLLTDGYADQFGGDEGKKFKFKNFKQLVLDISVKPLKDQRLILDERFEAWKGSLEQIDDVCVMGIKV